MEGAECKAQGPQGAKSAEIGRLTNKSDFLKVQHFGFHIFCGFTVSSRMLGCFIRFSYIDMLYFKQPRKWQMIWKMMFLLNAAVLTGRSL